MITQEIIRAAIRRHRLIERGDRLLVAVSGGADSVALLHLLYELREEFQLHLEVAHLQHGIRGEEAKEDARFVGALADRLGLRFHVKEVSVPAMRSAAGKGNLEALARAERYRFFSEVAAARRLTKVATGHTLDDQAETVVMRFLRGSGRKGLGGIAPVQAMNSSGEEELAGVTVIRPLLQISKRDLLAYLAERGQNFCVDRTNRDTSLLRNWLRLELLPKIRERVDGGLNQRLAQQAEIMRDEDAVLEGLARLKFKQVSRVEGLNRQALLAEPVAMQRRLLRLWVESVTGSLRGFDFDHIEALLRLIDKGPPNGRVALPRGWQAARQYDNVKLVRRGLLAKPGCYEYRFIPGQTLWIAEAGCEIRSEFAEPPLDRLPADLTQAVFDASGVGGPLTVRNFRKGDFFQPLGMPGHKKIKDLFIERKLPLAARAVLPLLVLGPEVLWVPGYARSERAKVTLETASILRLKVIDRNS